MSTYDYDLIVIGAGSGGISAANLGFNLGKKTTIVEKKKIGGDCTWFGCVPSKALIKVGHLAHEIKNMKKYGLSSSAPFDLKMDGVMAHVRAVRAGVYETEKPEVFIERGIDVHSGAPEFVDAHRIRMGDRELSSGRFVIATGSSPFVPPIGGLADVPYLTNETLFDLDALPESMVILGGGPIGIEMASVLNRLGVAVTVLQRGPRILPRDDEELVAVLSDSLREEGVTIMTGKEAIGVTGDDSSVTVTVRDNKGLDKRDVRAEKLLVSVGRTLNVDGLALERAGVEFTKKGIKTNDALQTTAGNIYAIGDVIGSYKFSHIAEYHAEIAVPNALLPLPVKRKVDYTNIVWATFTEPELAHGGLTEVEAREKCGDRITVYRHSYGDVDRARTDLTGVGMSKFICDKKGKLLGIHIVGERAAELLHEAQLAKSLGIPFYKIQSMVHVYPTYGDLVKRPAAKAYADKLQNNFFIKLARKFSRK